MNKVTVRDVAKEAGVSIATVSYVLNKKENQTISENTKEAVYRAVEKLHYVPNSAAKTLKKQRPACIGVAIEKSIADTRFSLFLQGIREVLDEAHYNIMLCSSQRRDGIYENYINSVLQEQTCGVIYVGKAMEGPSKESEEVIKNFKIPFVAYDCQGGEKEYSTIDFQYEESAYQMVHYYLSNKTKHILYIRPEINSFQERARERAVRKAVNEYEGTELEILTIESSSLGQSGTIEHLGEHRYMNDSICEALNKKLVSKYWGNGLVVASWGVIGQAFEMCALDFAPEKKWNIIALGDNRISSFGNKEMKIAHLPVYQAGRLSAQLLLDALEGKEAKHHSLKISFDR